MRLLLTGASGQLGAYLLRSLSSRGWPIVAWSGSVSGSRFGVPCRPVDLADADAVSTAFREARPEGVLHAGAMASVGACVANPQRAEQINTRGSALLAELAERDKIRLIHISTDLVFDGERGNYREEDAVAPRSVYGRTKAAAESAVLAGGRNLVARVSLLFGPTLMEQPTFFDRMTMALRERRPMALFDDEWRTPLSLETAAEALTELTASDAVGLLHLGGPERMSRWEMGQRLAANLGCDPSVFVAVSRNSDAAAEPRPRDTSLDSSRWRRLAEALRADRLLRSVANQSPR